MENKKDTLSLEEMEKVSGGLIVDGGTGNTYWVIRQDGTVIGPAPDPENADSYAKAFNISRDVITLEEYKKRFGRDLVW